MEFDIKVQHTHSRSVTFRNLKHINVSEFQSSLNCGNTDNLDELQSVYNKYENELTRVLNQLAPERTKFLTNWERRPWFDQDIAYQKRVLRRCEKIWLRYRTEACWQAYLHARRWFHSNIVENKKVKISNKIEECGSDSKKLFQLVNHLTSHKPENPLLTRNTDKELANEFADFFISKILKIRHELDKHPLYQQYMVNVPEFNQFSKLDKEQVMKLIMNTNSKSCELDPYQPHYGRLSYQVSYQ